MAVGKRWREEPVAHGDLEALTRLWAASTTTCVGAEEDLFRSAGDGQWVAETLDVR
jgi:hypothetical protein